MAKVRVTLVFLVSCLSILAHAAAEIETNNVHIQNPPAFVTRIKVEKIVAHIQTLLAWDIRRVEVKFYSDAAAYAKAQNLGPLAIAVTNKKENVVHLGPKIDEKNFAPVLTHELTHVIAGQKYGSSIPAWLEEGLASYLAKEGSVDYKSLASHPFPTDVRGLTHPYAGSPESTREHYQASRALVEMIAKKCDLEQLLQMSVGENMETHLREACEIPDLNKAYQKWVRAHG